MISKLGTESNRSTAGSPNSGELNPSTRSKLTLYPRHFGSRPEADERNCEVEGKRRFREGLESAVGIAPANVTRRWQEFADTLLFRVQ